MWKERERKEEGEREREVCTRVPISLRKFNENYFHPTVADMFCIRIDLLPFSYNEGSNNNNSKNSHFLYYY